jgi:hypothetical protein
MQEFLQQENGDLLFPGSEPAWRLATGFFR